MDIKYIALIINVIIIVIAIIIVIIIKNQGVSGAPGCVR